MKPKKIQLQANQAKLIQQISKKKNRYEKLQKELPFFMNSMVMLGQDVNKTEYWVWFIRNLFSNDL